MGPPWLALHSTGGLTMLILLYILLTNAGIGQVAYWAFIIAFL